MPSLLARLGIELGSQGVRAVRVEALGRERARGVEASWDPDHPEEAIGVLRELCGPVSRVAVALDFPFLFSKRVRLPIVSARERREILRLEPDRFFPVRSEELIPAVRPDGDLVFAARGRQVASWVAALEGLAPVALVEPGPIALARVLAQAGINGTVVTDGNGHGIGLVDIEHGRVTDARRLFGVPALAAALAPQASRVTFLSPWNDARAQALGAEIPGVTFQPLPAVAPVADPFYSAYGAALGLARRPELAETLVSPDLGRRIRARERREQAVASAVCVVAAALLFLSVDARRDRATHELDRRLVSLRTQAAPALALQTDLLDLGQRAAAIRSIDAERPDPLGVLLALSQRLPPGAFLRGVHTAGAEWQVDGYAPSAARVIAALGSTPGVTSLHFLSATNRAQVGAEPLETFALAFRFVPAP